MPQIDKLTYISIIYSVLISFFFVYLELSATYFYIFFTTFKFKTTRLGEIIRKIALSDLETRSFYINRLPMLALGSFGSCELSLSEGAYQYFNIWTPRQWISTVVLQAIGYGTLGRFYNKLAERWFQGYWMDEKTRVLLFLVDLILNWTVGIIIICCKKSFGEQAIWLIKMCPVVFSPLIMLIEVIVFLFYARKKIADQKKEKDELKTK